MGIFYEKEGKRQFCVFKLSNRILLGHNRDFCIILIMCIGGGAHECKCLQRSQVPWRWGYRPPLLGVGSHAREPPRQPLPSPLQRLPAHLSRDFLAGVAENHHPCRKYVPSHLSYSSVSGACSLKPWDSGIAWVPGDLLATVLAGFHLFLVLGQTPVLCCCFSFAALRTGP